MASIAIGSAVANIGGSLISSSGAQDAANTQAQAANQASQVQLQMFNQTQANEQPYMQAGGNALQALMYALGIPYNPSSASAAGAAPAANSNQQYVDLPFGGSIPYSDIPGFPGAATAGGTPTAAAQPQITGGLNFGQLTQPLPAWDPSKLSQTPGYQFQLQQGLQAIQDSASATGGVGGGNTLKALMGYGEGLASTTYQQQFQDYLSQNQQTQGQNQSIFNMLQTLAGSGQNAAANLGSLGSQTASNIGNNITSGASAQSAAQIAGSNALAGGINNLTSNFLLSSLLNGGGGGGGSAFGGSASGIYSI